MRAVKLLLFAAIAAGWWQLAQHQESVTAAYIDERPPLALELDGVGAVPVNDDRSVSPYALLTPTSDRAPTFLPAASEDPEDPEDEPAVQVTGGTASIDGMVTLTDGTPVAGATVRIERFTSDGQAVAETLSSSDGSWTAAGLQGGRLRVRAFAPNVLASVEPVVVVVPRNGNLTLTLRVVAPAEGLRVDSVGPLGIAVGATGTTAIVVSREVVDDVGRLVQFPVAGESLTATFTAPARLLSADIVITDAGGASRFLLACDAEGAPIARLVVDQEQPTLTIPPCLTTEALAELTHRKQRQRRRTMAKPRPAKRQSNRELGNEGPTKRCRGARDGVPSRGRPRHLRNPRAAGRRRCCRSHASPGPASRRPP